MSKVVNDHFERLRSRLLKRHSMATLASWVEANTFHSGQPYSFADHEYQKVILEDTSQEVVVRKCSQVGVSEASARLALAMTAVLEPVTVMYVLPTFAFAQTFMNTRISTVIHESEVLKSLLLATNDNASVKQLGRSFIYVKGTGSASAPISTPVDVNIIDELDFCDQTTLTQYSSRLTHSRYKLQRKFSTPTLPDYGIDRAFQNSRRHFNFCKCDKCNHQFVPDYYRDVKIPGFDDDLRGINKQSLTKVRWQEAVLLCPACGRQPSLQVQHRGYVCENPDENYVAAGYQVTPFDAPNVIATSYLVKVSTDYERQQDFVNFGLGLPMTDKEATLTREDFKALFFQAELGSGFSYVMGIDVGNVYHVKVGAVDGYGNIKVVHIEQVPMGRIRQRYDELRRHFRVVCTVMDSAPHAETLMYLQQGDPNLYASVFVNTKGINTHTVINREDEPDDGESFVRQVNVNRNRALDAYMGFLRDGHLEFRSSEFNEEVISHHLSMKRAKTFDNTSGEMTTSWQKTDGADHFHFAGLYMFVASKIMGVSRATVALPLFFSSKIRTSNL